MESLEGPMGGFIIFCIIMSPFLLIVSAFSLRVLFMILGLIITDLVITYTDIRRILSKNK